MSTTPFAVNASSSYSPRSDKDDNFRIAIMGAPAVGKSAILHQFVHSTFIKGYWATVKECYITDKEIDGRHVVLNIFDTPGAYRFANVRQLAIANADAFVLVYSVGDQSSFEMMAGLRETIVQQKPVGTPIIVVGNKTDLEFPPRFMSKEKAECLVTTAWQHDYKEASAKDNDTICDIFMEVVNQTQAFVQKEKRRMSAPASLLKTLRRRLRRTKSSDSDMLYDILKRHEMHRSIAWLIQPVGIRLCEERCFQKHACDRFHYDQVQLRCDLQSPGTMKMKINSSKRFETVCVVSQCHAGDRCIKNKRGRGVCIPTAVVDAQYNRLLVFISPLFTGTNMRNFMYQININTLSLESFNFGKMQLTDVRCVTYMPLSKKLLISHRFDGPKLEIFSMDGKESTILKERVAVITVTLDEEGQVIFYVTLSKRNKIERISTNGSPLAVLESNDIRGRTIVADTSSKILYVVHSEKFSLPQERKVVSMSYSGTNVKFHIKGYVSHFLFLQEEKVSYFVRNSTIYKKEISMKASPIANIDFTPLSLQIYREKVFAISEWNKIYYFNIIDIKKKQGMNYRSRVFITSKKIRSSYSENLCLIP